MSEKVDLARAGTMQATAQDGKTFLDKNLTDWKKPYLMDQFEEGENGEEEDEEAPKAKKPKIAKHTTMKGTAKEAEELLKDGKPDEDALTRGQQKQLDGIKDEKPSPKKAKMARDNTMAATAKEGKAVLGTAKLTKRGAKPSSNKRVSTIDKCRAEAEAVFGKVDASEGRSMRKRAAPAPAKTPMKKAGTMQKTAKEGKAFLKRGKKGGQKEAE